MNETHTRPEGISPLTVAHTPVYINQRVFMFDAIAQRWVQLRVLSYAPNAHLLVEDGHGWEGEIPRDRCHAATTGGSVSL